MNKFVVLFPVAMLGLSTLVYAFDSDPNPLADRSWSGGRRVINDPNAPLYYRPTQRYYGSGYTISYRYVPVAKYDGGLGGGSTNFRTEAFRLATDEIPAWGVNPPRLTVKDPKSAAPRVAVTSIVRKKPTGKAAGKTTGEAAPAETPAIVPAAEAPVPAPSAAAPIPVPAEAPKP